MKLNSLYLNRNRYLIAVFCVYIIILFGFALIYYNIYKQAPQSFSFNSDILQTQANNYKISAERDKATHLLNINLLQQFLGQIDSIPPPKQTDGGLTTSATVEFVTKDYRYIFIRRVSGVRSSVVISFLLVIRDQEDRDTSTVELPRNINRFPEDNEGYKQVIRNVILDLEQQLAEIQRRLDSLSGSQPEVWSFADFFYFSTITQTTVGYGDILPNSTMVRTIVTIQLIIGGVLLIIVVNLAFSRKGSDR